MHWILAFSSALLTESEVVLTGGWRASAWGACQESADAEATRGAIMPKGCTAGEQKRTVTCGLAEGASCIGAQPEDTRTCGYGDICGYTVSAWPPCDAECGEKGKQTRTALCTSPLLPGACQPLNIELQRECVGETQGCSWFRDSWSECSNSCGSGRERRHVACLQVQGCPDEKPATERPCEGSTCDWMLSMWTQCSQGCGRYGSQEREKVCPKEGSCSGTPEITRSCLGPPCDTSVPTPSTSVPRSASGESSASVAPPASAPTPAPSATPAPSGPESVPEFSWFIGDWQECVGHCGTWTWRKREVHCHRTCSVYRCPKVDFIKCESRYEVPHSMEDCGKLAPTCTTTTTLTPTSGPPPATMTINANSNSAPSMSKPASGSVVINGDAGGGAASSNPADWECLVTLGQKASECLGVTGARAGELCGAGCPCCRRKLVVVSGGTTIVSQPSEEGSSTTSLLIVALVVAGVTGIVVSIVYFVWSYYKRKQRLRTLQVRQTPLARKVSSRESADRRNLDDRCSRTDAWGDPFELPPEVEVDQAWQRKNDRGNEDDSTSDSEHEGDDAFVPRATRSQSYNTARVSAERQPRRAQTEPGLSGGASSRSKRDLPAAAEAAFSEGLQAGKVTEAERQRRHSEKKRSRSSSQSSRSAHPKGTAVPPRPQDAATATQPPTASSRPATSSAAGSASARSASAGSASAPPPSSSSGPASASATPPSSGPAASGQGAGPTPTRTSSTVAGESADAGASTLVNEHVLKLDADLDATRTKDLEFRRKNFKTLLLKWHPDKNTNGMGEAESSAQANEVFKQLLARRDRYLAE